MKRNFTLIIFTCLLMQCTKSSTSTASSSTLNSSTGGKGGSTARFAITGNYLYSVDETSLKSFDISDPVHPVLKNTVSVGFDIETIFPFNDKLFIGSSTAVYIFSIADPSKPTVLGTALSPTVMRRCDPVVAKDTVAFATLRASGPCGGIQSILAVYDIKEITNPIERGTLTLQEPYGLGYDDDVLYVCDRVLGLLVIDIKKPYYPSVIKTITEAVYSDVIPYNHMLICWTNTGIKLYDISDNRNPVFLANI